MPELPDVEVFKRYFDATSLHKAIEAGADTQRFPATFVTPHRHAGAVCPRCGAALAVLKVGGRTAYYCPRRQPAP